MKNTISVEAKVGNETIRIETGLLARLARGSVTVQLGETIVFSAVTASEKPNEQKDYFPLQVEYREKFYASGRFPGGFFKREARPSEKEILTSRFTDRPIRSLFQEGYRNEVQIYNILLSADSENESDVLSIVAASASLYLSDLPCSGPIGAVRVGRIGGQFVINPKHSERVNSDLNLIYVAIGDMPIMIEGDAAEIKEDDLVAAMKFGHEACRAIIAAQLELRRKLGLPDKVMPASVTEPTPMQAASGAAEPDLLAALSITDKLKRRSSVGEVKTSLEATLREAFPEMTDNQFSAIFDDLQVKVTRRIALEQKRRIDGRGFDEIRQLGGDTSLLPRAHGSALFMRGDTQALAIITLGTKNDSQSMDAITGGADEKTFMLHYNFPPFSVGEVGRLGFTGRREIGHGALAERSLEAVMPKDYPYTVRVVTEIMGSNGSSSMASICAGTMALMDAGVKICKPVAGISIGLFSNESQAILVTDIIGDEDHCGDMDFKVAGTREGITGFQLDLKIHGLAWDLVPQAFEKARIARLFILDEMGKIIGEPRADLSQHAPRVHVIKINPEKIGELIGPGGKNIRRITDITGAQIDIEDDGTVNIFSATKEGMEIAVREVSAIVAEAEEGKLYTGTVTGIKEFGAFVEILPGKDGLVHISELADFRVKCVEDICKLGDQMSVKCIAIDDRGRIKLSRRAAMQEKQTSDA